MHGLTIGITGVSGFIGRHLARRCLSLGAAVKGLDLRPPELDEIDYLEGDVTSRDVVDEFCSGCDVVIHTAALVKEGGDPALFERINVQGTRTVAQRARVQGVRRFLQISSVMVYGFRIQGEVVEESPLSGEGNPYCQTKIDSEKEVWKEHEPGEFDVTVLRCGDVYGPGSIPWTIRPIRMMKAGVFTLADGGRGVLNPVYIDNLVDGILLALDSPVTGETFNLTDGQAVPCREFFGHYARMLRTKKLRSAPAFMLQGALQVSSGFLSVFGLEPRIHPQIVPYLTRQGVYSISKARRVFGYAPRIGLQEGMLQTEDWLRQAGLILPRDRQASGSE